MSSYLLQQLVNGLQLGAIYALIALGYTLVYGVIKLINFAHADIFMVGAYVAFFAASFYAGSAAFPPQLCVLAALALSYLITAVLFERFPVRKLFRIASLPGGARLHAIAENAAKLLCITAVTCAAAPLLLVLSRALFSTHNGLLFFPLLVLYVMALCALLGVVMERIAYRPLRRRKRLSVLITALGVSYFLENFCSLPMVFESKYRAFPDLLKRVDILRVPGFDVSISNMFVINLAVCGLLLVLLWFLVEKTLLGKRMRAVAFNHDAAALMGIDVDGIISLTFVIGPALAGASGILYAMNYGVLQSPFLGFAPGMKAFIAAVLGGIGSLPGAVIGAFIMGVSEVFANSVDSNLGFAAAFIILMLILLVKPTGILGKSEQEKV
jgi:branched-chain amino acid transport system permease protein